MNGVASDTKTVLIFTAVPLTIQIMVSIIQRIMDGSSCILLFHSEEIKEKTVSQRNGIGCSGINISSTCGDSLLSV